jgi:hypothetical protein
MNNPTPTARLFSITLCIAGVAAVTMTAPAQVIKVYTGYDDFSGVSSPAPPDPWLGSPNTTFYGNAGQAASFDPDEDAVRFFNTGGTAVTLTAANIGVYDLFALDVVGGPITIGAGQNVILAGVDGSDVFGSVQTVGYTIDGQTHSYQDVVTAADPNGVLAGNSPWINGVETVPWTQINPGGGVPDGGSTLVLLLLAGVSLPFVDRRR